MLPFHHYIRGTIHDPEMFAARALRVLLYHMHDRMFTTTDGFIAGNNGVRSLQADSIHSLQGNPARITHNTPAAQAEPFFTARFPDRR